MPLSSPWLAAGLAALLLGLVWFGAGGPFPTTSPAASGSDPSGAAPSGGGTPTATLAGPSPSPTFSRPTPTPAPTFTSVVVRAGDSLNSIADRYGTTARSIAWWNRGTYPSLDPESEAYEPDHIEPGWVLVLIPGVVVDDASPPTPSPGLPTSTPGASVGPTPTAPSGGPAAVVSHGARGSDMIALTFDMGGRLDPAVDIVQWLIDHEVRATLFPTGKAGTTTAEGRDALLLAAAQPELFTFGNHSWDHPDLTGLTALEMADQLNSAETAILDLTGWTTRPWFRPPFGAWTSAVRTGVGAAGWPYLVMWDIDTIDWKPVADGGPTTDAMVRKVLDNAQGGSIVLMHLGGYNTLAALPRIIDGLSARGYQFATIGEMSGQ